MTTKTPPDIAALLAQADIEADIAAAHLDPHSDSHARDNAVRQDAAEAARCLRLRAKQLLDKRKSDLGAIHAAAKQQGIDEDTRRDMIGRISNGRTRTSADLTAPERSQLLKEIGGRRAPKRAGRAPSPAALDRRAMLAKVQALLADSRLPWSYAEAILRRQRGILDKSIPCPIEQTSNTELRGVIAALSRQAKRRVGV